MCVLCILNLDVNGGRYSILWVVCIVFCIVQVSMLLALSSVVVLYQLMYYGGV